MENQEEPRSFWVYTAIIVLIFAVILIVYTWFVYTGHEKYEPVHDEQPHATLNKIYETRSLDKGII